MSYALQMDLSKSICHSPMCHQQRWARIVPAWKAEMQRRGLLLGRWLCLGVRWGQLQVLASCSPTDVWGWRAGAAARPAGAGAASSRCQAGARCGWRGGGAVGRRWSAAVQRGLLVERKRGREECGAAAARSAGGGARQRGAACWWIESAGGRN